MAIGPPANERFPRWIEREVRPRAFAGKCGEIGVHDGPSRCENERESRESIVTEAGTVEHAAAAPPLAQRDQPRPQKAALFAPRERGKLSSLLNSPATWLATGV